MTLPTGAGWYPDPRHTGAGPAPERWWNGTDWTGHTRAAGQGPPGPAGPAGPPPERLPSAPGTPGTPAGGRLPLIIAVTGALLVLSGLVIAAVLLFGGEAADDPETEQAEQSEAAEEAGEAGEAGESETGESGPPEPPRAAAEVGGAALPLPDGWEERPYDAGAAVTTTAGYPCPADEDQECRTAGAFLLPATGPASATPRQAATADVAAGARASYAPDAYGAIDAHTQVLAGEVAVAGERGYRVRWRVETAAGTAAYAETVAFPAPDGSGRMLLLRLGFDIGDGAPPASGMERIIQGVRPVSDAPGSEA